MPVHRQALGVTGNFKPTMTQPTFPLICISDDGGLEIISNESLLSKVSTLALIDPTVFDKAFLFDRFGRQWTYIQVAEIFKNTWLTKVLAMTFYNPTYDAKVIWKLHGSYEINYLKNQLNNCIDKDDDIITQFEEAGIIKEAIDKASSFDDILIVLNKYVFSVDEELLRKEQEKRQQ